MHAHSRWLVSLSSLIVLTAFCAVITLPASPALPVLAGASPFIEEQVYLDSRNARISLPVVYGFGSQDDYINAELYQMLGVHEVLQFVEGARSSRWNALFRYNAYEIGNAFYISAVRYMTDGSGAPIEQYADAYLDTRNGDLYTWRNLFVDPIEAISFMGICTGQAGQVPQAVFCDGNGVRVRYADQREYTLSLNTLYDYFDRNGALYQALIAETAKEVDEERRIVL